MRVLVLSWEFPPHVVGGLGKHVADLVPALARQSIDVHVVTPRLRDGPDVERICDGVTVYRVPPAEGVTEHEDIVRFSQASNANLERAGLDLAERLGGFDLLHGHDWLVAYASSALKYALRIPLVVTVHSMERGRMQNNLVTEQSLSINGTEWWLTYEAWRVITVSHYMAQQAHAFFGVPFDKLDVIHNGVTLPEARMTVAERQSFRRSFADPDEQIVFYVGRIVHEKGVQVLIDAIPHIVSEVPRVRFVIAGTGAYLDVLRRRVAELQVTEYCTFAGFIQDEVRDKLYQVADVAVFPSLYEPFGIVALEAMAYGCPVVASETGGLVEFVKPHETGITVRAADASSLAWGILHTLQHPKWAARRATNALQMVETLYSWDRIASKTLHTYQQAHESWRHSSWGR